MDNSIRGIEMKKWHLVAVVFGLSLGGAFAFEYPLAPETDFFNSALWRQRNQVVIPPAGLELQQDTLLKMDELVLQGPLYANGFSLRIDALQITFEPGGAIRSFKNPAPQGATRQTGATGPQATGTQGTGGNGHTPSQADPGVNGEQNPRATVIYAARFQGPVVIDGTGQTGGKGGTGGQGGRGGRGGPGRRARADCLGLNERDASAGGTGGKGAPGGRGGIGGRGGAPVPLVVVGGAALPPSAVVVSKVGAPGAKGDAGAPGERGPGGPGGLGDSADCVFWTARKDGGPTGAKGPHQTATLGPGEDGPTGPIVNLTTEPLPTFSEFLNPNVPGVVNTHLATLEEERSRLVGAWAQFHWARGFAFLILDTLTELQAQEQGNPLGLGEFTNGGSSSTLLDSILAESQTERLKELIRLWNENLIQPFKDAPTEAKAPLIAAGSTAMEVVQLLEKLLNQEPAGSVLKDQLERVRSAAQAQLQGALDNALKACQLYNETKLKQLPVLLNLTSQYGVPVCEGSPDFRLAENIDKAIYVFHKTKTIYDPWLEPYHRQLADLWRLLNPIPVSHAEGFAVVGVNNGQVSAADVTRQIPDRGIWQATGQGVFMGFPSVTRAASIAEVGQKLFYLQHTLKRIRSR